MTPWTDAEKTAFVDMQFRAQHTHYRQHYPDADWLVAMRAGEQIGRLYLERTPARTLHHRHHLPAAASRPGIRRRAAAGFAWTRRRRAGKAVEIHVEKFNPAMRLYRRLGFRTEEDAGVYDRMRWNAG